MLSARLMSAVFAGSLSAVGSAHAASEAVLYSFEGGADGSLPVAGLTKVAGTLYGATFGADNAFNNSGTVFAITPAGIKTTLYNFPGNPVAPYYGNLVHARGKLYGTTYAGGSCSSPLVTMVAAPYSR